ncbi:MAG TPA: class I SAM-dependent methyltransferase [Candidatus Sumerlaeota bacterium]|nr:class I SAM-dependent methyltransferase [Candidatus Sumerlaeota bacterium]HPS02502.1 class I SAM-dependent methyltransferase [Candidatus Sumerlaeota bacterium]
MSYLFGDSDIAALRLEYLTEIFGGAARLFLQDAEIPRAGRGADLGCGPGFTTRLVADTVPGASVTGLDVSDHFLELARRFHQDLPNVEFYLHDITQPPFPGAPFDFIYGRFILTHLPEPARAIQTWSSQLRPGGLLLLEETDWIQAGNPAFQLYLDIVNATLARKNNILYIGPQLEALALQAPLLRLKSNRVREHTVSSYDVARMFCLNIRTWKNDPLVREHFSQTQVERLEADLMDLRDHPRDDQPTSTWGLRQIALERVLP